MTDYNAGNAYLQILPSFRGIERMMQRETAKLARDIDKSIAQGTNDGILKAFRSIDTDKVAKAASDTGDKWSAAFERQIGRHLKDAADSLPDFEPKAKLNRFDRAIAQTKKQLAGLSETQIGPGGAGLDDVSAQLDHMVSRMVRLADETKHMDQRMRLLSTAGQADMLKGLIDDARRQGLTDGRAYGGAFTQGAMRSIEQAINRLPEINLDADPTPAERAVAALRAQLIALSEKKIGVDIDRDRFQQELSYVAAQIESLARDPKSITLKYDLDEAAKGLRKFGETVAPTLDPALEKAGEQGGEVYAGAYVEKVRRRLADAIQQIPNIPMTADNTDVERKLAAIRVSMEELSNKRIGVDIDAGAAQAQIEALLERLRSLDRADVDIDVRTNALAAAAQLELVKQKTDESSTSMQEFANNAGITMSRLGYLIAIGASMGSILAPAAATAAVAVAGIGVAAAGALAGIGVLALGVVGIADAVKKMDAYQLDANKSARSLSQANSRVASAQDSVASAERNLSNTRANNAEAERSARERVADAERSVGKARRDAARALRDAERSDVDAQRDLVRAQADQRDSRRELNEALRDGVRALRELDTESKKNQNDIDQATTAAMTAKLELDKILTNPRSSEIEKRMARETYQEKLIQIEDLKNKQADLQVQQAKAAKDGVNSLDSVVAARKKVADQDEKVRAANERAQVAAQRLDDVRVDNAERIADATRGVASAQRAATSQQRQAQQSLASGQQQLISAQRALTQAFEGTGVAGGEALDNLNDSLRQLSPAGQDFVRFLYGLKPVLKSLRDEAQQGLLPGVQDGIEILIDKYLPSFRDFVGKIALGLGDMFRATTLVLSDPKWEQFFGFISQTALPAMQGLWVASLNLARGIANLVRNLSPLSAPMGEGLLDLTERFADWSDALETNNSFQEFLSYAKEEGPNVVHLIGEMVTFLGRLLVAMAPIGAVIVSIATAVFEWMNSWDIGTLQSVVEIVAILGTGVWALTGFVRTVKFVTEAWTAVTLVSAKAQTILAAAVARYNAATVGATTSTGLLNGALFRTGGASAAGAAGMTAITAAVGPLALALAGLAAIYYLQTRGQRKAQEATNELGDGLKELGQAYQQAAESATVGGSAVSDSLRRITAQNTDMQKAVVALTGMGASIEQIGAAAGGSKEDLQAMVDLIDQQIAHLSDEKNKHFFDIFDNEERDNQQEYLYELRDSFTQNAEAAGLANKAMGLLNQSVGAAAVASQTLTPIQQALAEAHAKLGDESATAQDKMDALNRAQQAIQQAAIDGIEADESYNSSLLTLGQTVQGNKDAHDKYATSLEMTNLTGLQNRDMLENLISSANRMYDADVALNGVTTEAVDKGNDHIQQIKDLAAKLGLSKTATDRLVASFSHIPEDVETAIGFKEGDFDKMFEQLEMAAFIQEGLRKNIPLAQVKQNFKDMINDRRRAQAHGWSGDGYGIVGYAGGGELHGPGTKTSDDILMWGSPGEFMQQASAVDYYGTDFMQALNSRAIPKDVLPGFAAGGSVLGGKSTWPFQLDVAKTFIPTAEDLQAQMGATFDGVLGSLKGKQGYRWQMSVLHKMFPGLALISGYRPGSRTLSGNLSYHARGRAVDVPPRRDVAEWIAKNYGASTKELITPWRDLMLWNGHPHKFSRAIEAQHGVFGKNAHVHWAYDDGGMLPPGVSTVFNGTGRPEPVLTAPQWDAVIKGDGLGGAAGDTYNIEFAENKLTLADLEAHQQRKDTLARVGRPR